MKDKWSVLGHRQRGVKAGWLAVLFLCGAISGWAADAETFKVTVIREPASIRDASGARLLDLNKDAVLVVIQPEEGNAYKVQTDEADPTVGYISRNLVRRVEEIAPRSTPVRKDSPSPADEKSWLARYWGWAAGGAAVVVGGVALAAAGGGGGGDASAEGISGTWSGRSASTQVASTLVLYQSGSSVSGNLNWPGGDTRSVSGSVSGTAVTLYIGGGDVWRMTWSDNTLRGTGQKAGGGSYALTFTR